MAHSLFDISTLEPLIQQGCVFLTPNSRLSRRISEEWNALRMAAGDRVWEPLAVYPVERWLLGEWERAQRLHLVRPLLALSRQQELQVWQQVIAAHARSAEGVSLLRPAGAAELASDARDLLVRWRVNPHAGRERQLFLLERDCAIFLDWLELFDQRLDAAGQCTQGDALVALAEVAGELRTPRAALVECEDLAPLVRQCLDRLCEELHVAVASGVPSECTVHSFSNARAELQGVATWAAALHREAPDTTVGIVLAGSGGDRVSLEYLLRREIDCLGENYNSLPVNFSAGISLALAPVVRDALAVLSLGLERVSVSAVVALLRSRFLDLPDANSALAAYFVERLYDGGSAELPVAALRNYAGSVHLGEQGGLSFGRHLLAMFEMRELRGRASPSTWIERFNSVLSTWGWPGREPLDSLEFQQVRRWYETLDEFRTLDAVCPPMDFGEALGLLREMCDRQVSHPQTADSPVQVLGPLEAVGLAFDHLWVCGMQAASWPASPRPNPFVPLSLQAAGQMPHATHEREWAFGETLLRQYRDACDRVHASYSRQVDGVPDLPSALIAEFPERAVEDSVAVDPGWAVALAGARRESRDDSVAPTVDAQELAGLHGGAGLLEHQSQCPFRAFATHRLQVAPLAEFGPGLSAAERGTVVHEALRALWVAIGDHAALLAMNDMAREAAVAEAAALGMQSLRGYRRRALGVACLELEEERLKRLLLEWLAVESARGSFVVEATEKQVELTLAQLVIRLRVDRVDRLADGSRVIIDYKTGKARISDWLGERPVAPQLLLYGLAARTPPAALAFAQVRPGDSAFSGVGVVGDTIPGVSGDIAGFVGDTLEADDWDSLNTAWAGVLERLARSFVVGEASIDPLSNSCTWCGLQPLCRIDRVDAGEEGV